MNASSPADRVLNAVLSYSEKFNSPSPMPFGVSDEWRAAVLEQAVADGVPISADFDWYPDMPEGAVA